MLANLVLTIAAATFQVQPPATGLVYGQVRSGQTDEPLRYAVVQVFDPVSGDTIRAETDRNGFYYLQNIPAGWRELRATHFDHAPLEIAVRVRAGVQSYLDFELELRPVVLPQVNVRASNLPTGLNDTTSARPGELGSATVHALEATPGMAELGLAQVARDVPGQDPPDPSDALFVRGGGADLKFVLLNGAPVYAPFHIGGLIQALDTDLLRSATLYLGGAPARYDGGLSYIMDMETRSGRSRQAHATVSFDMLSARTILEGPLGRHASILAGARAVHGLGTTPFVGAPFPYTYGDALARADIDLGVDGNVSITGFWNRERVLLDSVGVIDQAAQWGNAAGSVRYRTDVAGADALFTVAVGEFRTQLPLGETNPVITEALASRRRLSADLARTVGPVRFHFGGSFDRLEFEHRAWPRGGSRDSTVTHALMEGDIAGVYVDADVLAGRRIRLRGGLRADVFSLSPATRIAPRMSATILITNRAALTLAAGRYRQYVRSSQQSFPYIVTDDDDQPRLHVARAKHFLAALDQDLGHDMSLKIEGFFKAYDGLPASSGEEANAAGLDLWVRRSGGSLTGWFGYSLAWVWSTDEDPFTVRPIFAGRHLVSAGVSGPIPARGEFEVRVAYGAGLPYTAIPEPETTPPVFGVVGFAPAMNAATAEPIPTVPDEPNEPYLRLDAQVARTFIADWRGFAFELTPYVKVLNALDRRDALFYHLDSSNGGTPEPRALAALPLLPIIGLEWKF
jgi:Carboxypeptidase regulatory-like domain